MPGLDAYRLDGHILDGFQSPPIDPLSDVIARFPMHGDMTNIVTGSTITASIYGTAAYAAGRNGLAYVGDTSSSLEFATGSFLTGNFAVTCWFNLVYTSTTWRRFFSFYDNGRMVDIETDSNRIFSINASNVGGANRALHTSFTQNATWIFLTFQQYHTTIANSYYSLSFNGSPYLYQTGRATSLTGNISTPLRLSNTSYPTKGLIEDVCLWNRNLTQNEEQYLYNNGLGRP